MKAFIVDRYKSNSALRLGADTQADTDTEVPLVNEQPTVREDGDAWCACLGH